MAARGSVIDLGVRGLARSHPLFIQPRPWLIEVQLTGSAFEN
jgi:hypothetical protein